MEIMQDGLSPQQWLEQMHEFEYCAECGGDTEDHIVTLDILGKFHSTCLHPITEE